MRTTFRLAALLALLTGLLRSHPAVAQLLPPVAPGRAYEFMTVTLIESFYAADTRLLLAPAFKGRSEVRLEEIYNLGSDKYRANLQRNTLVVNQALGELSEAGWELISVQSSVAFPPPASPPIITRYLLRRVRP